MKFKVAISDLTPALRAVNPCVQSNPEEMSSHYLFRYKDPKSVEVLAFGGRCFASCVVLNVEAEDGKSFTIEGHRLGELLGVVGSDTATLWRDGAVTKVSLKDLGKEIDYPGKDPDLWPYWDKSLATAVVTSTVDAAKLSAALSYVKMFIYGDDRRPDLNVTEVQNGGLYATDITAATVVSFDGLDKITLRIHQRDVADVISFLGTVAEGDTVEILETDTFAAFRRKDGASFGVAKTMNAFPKLAIDRNSPPHHWWDVNKADAIKALKILATASDKDDQEVTLRVENGIIKMSRKGSVGKNNTYEIACPAQDSQPAAPTIPTDGFQLSAKHLLTILSNQDGEIVRIDINQKARGGWLRFNQERDGINHTTVLIWKV